MGTRNKKCLKRYVTKKSFFLKVFLFLLKISWKDCSLSILKKDLAIEVFKKLFNISFLKVLIGKAYIIKVMMASLWELVLRILGNKVILRKVKELFVGLLKAFLGRICRGKVVELDFEMGF